MYWTSLISTTNTYEAVQNLHACRKLQHVWCPTYVPTLTPIAATYPFETVQAAHDAYLMLPLAIFMYWSLMPSLHIHVNCPFKVYDFHLHMYWTTWMSSTYTHEAVQTVHVLRMYDVPAYIYLSISYFNSDWIYVWLLFKYSNCKWTIFSVKFFKVDFFKATDSDFCKQTAHM